jgi:uncharacterized protein YqeY
MLKQRLLDDVKAAMKAGDKPRLATLRLASAAFKQREVDERIQLDDSQVIAVLEKMLKQRRESISQYESAGRTDLADQEKYEMGILQEYMPEALSESEIAERVEAAIASTGAASIREMGKVLGLLKPTLQGRADMAQVSALVKRKLSG